MPNTVQPAATNDNGVVLTVGILSGPDRCAIVLPLGTDSSEIDANNLCADAVLAFNFTCMTLLTACLSTAAQVTFLSADGMVDGKTPSRQDFIPNANQGLRGENVLPSQVAALLYFYRDADQEVGTPRVKLGKNFVPGIANEDVVVDILSTDLVDLLITFSDSLQNGFPTQLDSSKKWYRYLAMPKERTTGTSLIPTYLHGCRQYVGTQRRRLIPH
jgi:hypothetical protein